MTHQGWFVPSILQHEPWPNLFQHAFVRTLLRGALLTEARLWLDRALVYRRDAQQPTQPSLLQVSWSQFSGIVLMTEIVVNLVLCIRGWLAVMNVTR